MPTSSAPVLVLGVTGKTGRAVARALLSRGATVRGLSRQPSPEVPPGVELITGDLLTGQGLDQALAGAGAVHFIAPNLSADETSMMATLIDAAQRHDVSRVVMHSVMHPHVSSMPHHWRKAEAEQLLRASTAEWTILQPAAYHQNLFAGLGQGQVRVPYSLTQPFTNVDLGDVAEVSAAILLDEPLASGAPSQHRFATYELAGPQRLSVTEMAEQATAVVGRPVRAVRAAPPEGQNLRISSELLAMFDHYNSHGFVGSPTVLAHLLGRTPTSWRVALANHLSPHPDNT